LKEVIEEVRVGVTASKSRNGAKVSSNKKHHARLSEKLNHPRSHIGQKTKKNHQVQ